MFRGVPRSNRAIVKLGVCSEIAIIFEIYAFRFFIINDTIFVRRGCMIFKSNLHSDRLVGSFHLYIGLDALLAGSVDL